jgi:hypothetical protein
MSSEVEALMQPVWTAADRALRADVGMLVVLAEMARAATAALSEPTVPGVSPTTKTRAKALTPEQRDRYRANARAKYAAKRESRRAAEAPDFDSLVAAGAVD